MDERLTITEVARAVGVTPRTIMRWEKSGKIKRPKRDWRRWRFYYREDLAEIKKFFETSYEYNGEGEKMVNISKGMWVIVAAAFLGMLIASSSVYAESSLPASRGLTETETAVSISLDGLPVMGTAAAPVAEDVKYTLGPNDAIAIEVRRHPEFSGQYIINSEGKIEYKFVGDIIVSGLTKTELKERLGKIISQFIKEPEIDVSIIAYLSKVFYVVGEVSRPGKFFMKGNTVTVLEAIMQAGLPAETAAMRGCRLITPDNVGKNNYVTVNVHRLLYKGDLNENVEMEPGDVLYVPSTVMAKIIRVISPVTAVTGKAAGAARTGAAF